MNGQLNAAIAPTLIASAPQEERERAIASSEHFSSATPVREEERGRVWVRESDREILYEPRGDREKGDLLLNLQYHYC